MASIYKSQPNASSNKPIIYVREITKARYFIIFAKDIILTITFFVLNMILGSLLVIRLRSSDPNFFHAILLLVLPWVASFILIPNKYNMFDEKAIKKLGIILITFCLDPILPSIIAIRTLCGRIEHSDELRKFKKNCLLRQMIHTSLFLILTIFLIIRGTIDLELETCVMDQLGRGTCLSYLALITFFLALVLCVWTLIEYRDGNTQSVGVNCCNVIYRTVTISVIVNYLDYWSAIPLSIFIGVNIVTSGYTLSVYFFKPVKFNFMLSTSS